MRRSTAACLAAGLVLSIAATGASSAVQIVDFDLDWLDVPGVTEAASTSWAINNQRQIVGWFPAGSDSMANARGFLATPDGAGGYSVSQFPQLSWVQPYDISDSGVSVGQSRVLTQSTAPRYAFGNSNPQVSLLGTPPTESKATGINSSGKVVGSRTVSGRIEAFYYDGTAHDLPPFAAGSVMESRAVAINDKGQIAGYYIPQGGSVNDYRGFLYDWDAQELTQLGSITGPVATQSDDSRVWNQLQAYDVVSINEGGQVAATQLNSTNHNHAVLINGAQVIDLGVVGDFEESFAAGISDTDWVVGFLRDSDLSTSGFLWAAGKMFDLTDLLPASSGWEITVVHGVYSHIVDPKNPLVQEGTIVGEGTYTQGCPPLMLSCQRAFAMQITLQVPEPQTYLMLGVGVLALGALRMRRLTAR